MKRKRSVFLSFLIFLDLIPENNMKSKYISTNLGLEKIVQETSLF